MVGNAYHNMKSKISLINLFASVLDREHISLTRLEILIHFSRFQLVFDSQLDEIPKVIMSAVECARLFILDQIH